MKKIIIKSIFDISGLSNVFVKKKGLFVRIFIPMNGEKEKMHCIDGTEIDSDEKERVREKNLRLIETVDRAGYSLIK